MINTTQPAIASVQQSSPVFFGEGGKILAESCGLILLVAGVIAVMTKWMNGKLVDAQDKHKGVHDVIERDLREVRSDIKDQGQRVDALFANTTDHDRRITRVESAIENLEDKIDTGFSNVEKRLDEVVDSIREIRKKD